MKVLQIIIHNIKIILSKTLIYLNRMISKQIVLLIIILLNLIFHQGKIREFRSFFSYLLIFTVSLLMLFSHAYSIIVILSINFYIFLIWVIKKDFTKNNTFLFLS